MKAWRNIKGNNGKRPTQRTKIYGSTWLLDGLLIRAGIIDPLPLAERKIVQYNQPPAKLSDTAWKRIKQWLFN